MVTMPVTGLFQTTVFWFKEFIDHRDPHLLGPPLRPDPQSYSALSDYLLPTPTLLCGIVSAIVLLLFPRRFCAPSLNDAVSLLYVGAHVGKLVGRLISSYPGVGFDVSYVNVLPALQLQQSVRRSQPDREQPVSASFTSARGCPPRRGVDRMHAVRHEGDASLSLQFAVYLSLIHI